MKVYFKYGVSAYSGMVDEMVYQKWFKGRLCLSRRFSYPEITVNNKHVGDVARNLRTVYKAASSLYIADLKQYAALNKRQNKSRYAEFLHPMPSAPALFLQMMFAWQATDPQHIDLATVTLADIVSIDADVRTIKRAVEASFMRPVTPCNTMTHDIQG